MKMAGSAGVVCCAIFASAAAQKPVEVVSPDGKVRFELANGDFKNVGTPVAAAMRSVLHYRVSYRGKALVDDSELGLELQGQSVLGSHLRQTGVKISALDETWTNRLGKSSTVRNHFNAATVSFVEDSGEGRRLDIDVRVYDDGVAFRYVLPEQAALRVAKITRERTEFLLHSDATVYPLLLQNFTSSYEDEYVRRQVSNLHPQWLIGLPLLAEMPGTAWVAVTEAEIAKYPGMYLRHEGDFTSLLRAELSPRPDMPGVAAVVATPMQTPWRVVMIGDEPGRLVESNLVLNLNPPTAMADTSWIRPGKTAWDWWSGDVVKGAKFAGGMNTATMKHYIDFASASGFPYMVVDDGWARPLHEGTTGEIVHMADITHVSPTIDMPELLRYAQEKHVRLWLWAYWGAVERSMDEAFALYESWGIAGVKIDFMQRDDQWMVDFYQRVAECAAKHHLMVDFHGAYKPDGNQRTWPNLITREGVMGLEYSKWSALTTPVHNTTLPFTRMLAGPMDYTPGGFLNATRETFVPRMVEPMVLGTRAHQLALYVVFESPLQMVADFPERYAGEKDFEFIRRVPTTWDETHVLAGRPMEWISMARRHGDDWYVGSITNWDARDLELPLNFLGEGKYVAEMYADAGDADRIATHAVRSSQGVSRSTVLKVHLAPGGGNAVWIHAAGRE
jgi:alpha-glucosidase